MLKLFRVDGFSMYPRLQEGTILLCVRIFSFNTIKKNELVLFKHKSTNLMVKEVVNITKNGYFVQGKNSFSIDSRNFGELKKKQLLYRVIYSFNN